MESDTLNGSVAATMILGVILIRWAAARDQGFPEYAIASFDEVSGQLLAETQGKLPTNMMASARKIFRDMVTQAEASPPTQATPTPQKSWRRWFRDWLDAG
jgi:hypothetical protein